LDRSDFQVVPSGLDLKGKAALPFGVRLFKEEAVLPSRAAAGQEAFFITLGGRQAQDSSGRDDKFVAKTELSENGTQNFPL
jgi:hypothetical protein